MTDHPSAPDDTSPAGPDWEAIARHLAGEGTAEERSALRAVLEAHPERAALLRALDDALEPGAVQAPVDVEAALASVRRRRQAAAGLSVRRGSPRFGTPWRIAAGIVAFAAAGAGVLRIVRAPVNSASDAATQLAMREAAPRGAARSVMLSDGTRVVLAPGSALRVSAGYGTPAREVSLEGEALFTVRHDAARPFAVHAGGAVVRDLGTEFTVRADAGVALRVSVASGSVSVTPPAGAVPAELRAGDVAELREGAVVVSRGAADADDSAFAQGRLVWRDAPLDRVRADLRRWYGVTLLVPDSALATRHLTASFGRESSDEALRVVAAALGGDLRRQGDTATVRAPSPGRAAPR